MLLNLPQWGFKKKKKSHRQDLRENLKGSETKHRIKSFSNKMKWRRNIFGLSVKLSGAGLSQQNLLLSTFCSAVLHWTAVLISQVFQFSHSPQWALYTKSPFIVAMLSSTLSPSFASLSFLTLPFCSQANKRVSVSFLKILLCNQLLDKPPHPSKLFSMTPIFVSPE